MCVFHCVGVNECSGLHLWVSQPIIPQRQSHRVVTESEGQSEGFCTSTHFLQPPPLEKNTRFRSLKQKRFFTLTLKDGACFVKAVNPNKAACVCGG